MGLPPKADDLLLSLVGQLPVAVALFDTKLRYLAVSPHYLSDIAWLTSGQTFAPADVIGRSLYETFPNYPARWRQANSRALAGEKIAEQEEAVCRQGGGIEWCRWSLGPWRTADRRIGGVLVFGEIITDEVKAKHALADSEARFRATFENAAVGIAHLSPELHWLRANEAYSRIVGWPFDEILTLSPRELTRPDDFAQQLAFVEQMRLGNIDSYKLEKRYVRRNGAMAWGRLTASCVRKGDGSVDYFVHVLEDIAGEKRAEEQLRRQADLLNQSHDAILTWKISDPGRGIVYWSRGAEMLYGYTAAEAAGRISHELLQTRAAVPLEKIEAEIVQQGRWYGELTHTTRDGREIVVESRHVRVSYDHEPYALETNRDITGRKHAEEQIRLLMREMNHRSKNLLSLVQAIARQTVASDPEHFIERFTDRIQALAASQDLLVGTDWKGVGVDDLVRGQLAHFSDLIEGHRISLNGPKLRLSGAAAMAIGMALHELATNASKYGALSTDTGHVDIDWRVERDLFRMRWTECNGPPVRLPERQGFGTFVMEAMAKQAVDGDIKLEYDPAGLAWRLTCPAANALER